MIVYNLRLKNTKYEEIFMLHSEPLRKRDMRPIPVPVAPKWVSDTKMLVDAIEPIYKTLHKNKKNTHQIKAGLQFKDALNEKLILHVEPDDKKYDAATMRERKCLELAMRELTHCFERTMRKCFMLWRKTNINDYIHFLNTNLTSYHYPRLLGLALLELSKHSMGMRQLVLELKLADKLNNLILPPEYKNIDMFTRHFPKAIDFIKNRDAKLEKEKEKQIRELTRMAVLLHDAEIGRDVRAQQDARRIENARAF
jgi:hypothetical protein